MSVAGFIASQRTEHGVSHAVACRALDVSESWFYKWHDREPTPRRQRRRELTAAVEAVFTESGCTYGSPRVGDELREQGWAVSDNTIAQVMADNGWVARRVKRPRSTTRQGKRPAAPDLVRPQFTAVAQDVLWCGDVTEIPTAEGKLYLATVEDRFSGRLLGYATSAHHDAELACAALRMAATTRGGFDAVDGVIFHSDRGSEYTAAATNALCRSLGVVQSMGRAGSALDNSPAESFNSLLKVEVVHRHRFRTRVEAGMRIVTWITGFYNPKRRHSLCGGMSPINYENQMVAVRAAAAAALSRDEAA
ncbi:IS3 family transposase [Nocardia sp. NPDC004568]|uniref:IS3 family transposase n=1 Tax=Nocardia sp. NPDC004568 TaxID=3154551 RepID=UPI0033BF5A30